MKKHICIDFEGEGRKKKDGSVPHPSLLGAWIPKPEGVGGDYYLWVLESELIPITRPPTITGKPANRKFASLEDAIAQLVKLADTTDCRLVAFSEHEKTVIETHLPGNSELLDAFLGRFFNIRPKAVRLTKQKELQNEDNSLTSLLTALRPQHRWPPAPTCGVAEACRRLRSAGAKSKRWRQWSEANRRLAVELIRYNRGDCEAVMRLVNRVSKHYKPSELL